jgi:N-glycosylase/DNA lyase
MDAYRLSLTRSYPDEEYCQTITVRVETEEIHALVHAFSDFLESSGFPRASIAASLQSAAARIL